MRSSGFQNAEGSLGRHRSLAGTMEATVAAVVAPLGSPSLDKHSAVVVVLAARTSRMKMVKVGRQLVELPFPLVCFVWVVRVRESNSLDYKCRGTAGL